MAKRFHLHRRYDVYEQTTDTDASYIDAAEILSEESIIVDGSIVTLAAQDGMPAKRIFVLKSIDPLIDGR